MSHNSYRKYLKNHITYCIKIKVKIYNISLEVCEKSWGGGDLWA